MEPLEPPKRLHHLAVKARDVERVAGFYREALGLIELNRHTDERGLRSIWLSLGDAIVMIERSSSADTAAHPPFADDPPGIHLFALAVPAERIPAWRSRLEALGHPIVFETRYTIYVVDPEGNRVALSSFPEPAGASSEG